jgi:hypothetical protein
MIINRNEELLVERLIRVFDFFYGLNILYKKIKEGVESSYGGGSNGVLQKM